MLSDSSFLLLESSSSLAGDIDAMTHEEHCSYLKHLLLRPNLWVPRLLVALGSKLEPGEIGFFIEEIHSFFLVVSLPSDDAIGGGSDIKQKIKDDFQSLIKILVIDGLQKVVVTEEDDGSCALLMAMARLYHLLISRFLSEQVSIPTILSLQGMETVVGDILSGWISQFFVHLKMGLYAVGPSAAAAGGTSNHQTNSRSTGWSSLLAWINYFGFLLIHRSPSMLLPRLIPFFLGVWDLLLAALEADRTVGSTSNTHLFPACATHFLLKSVEHQLTSLMEIPEAERYTALLIDALERQKKLDTAATSTNKTSTPLKTAAKKRSLKEQQGGDEEDNSINNINNDNNDDTKEDQDILRRTCEERVRGGDRKKEALIDVTHLPINSISRLLLLSLLSLNPLQMEMLPSTLDKWRPPSMDGDSAIGGLSGRGGYGDGYAGGDDDNDNNNDGSGSDEDEPVAQDPRKMMMMMQDNDNEEEEEEESISPQVHFRRLLFTTLNTLFPQPSKVRWMHTKSLIRLALLLESDDSSSNEFTGLVLQHCLRSSSTAYWSRESILGDVDGNGDSIGGGGGPDELLYFLGMLYCKAASSSSTTTISNDTIWKDYLIPFLNDKIRTTASVPTNLLWPLWLGRLLAEAPPGFCDWSIGGPFRDWIFGLISDIENGTNLTGDPLSYYDSIISLLIGGSGGGGGGDGGGGVADGNGLLGITSIRSLVLKDILSMVVCGADVSAGAGAGASPKYLSNIIFRRRLIDSLNSMSNMPVKLEEMIDLHLVDAINRIDLEERMVVVDVISGSLEFLCRRAFFNNASLLDALFLKTKEGTVITAYVVGQFPIIIPLLQQGSSAVELSLIVRKILEGNCELLPKFLEPCIRVNLLKGRERECLEGVFDVLLRRVFSSESCKKLVELLMKDHLGYFGVGVESAISTNTTARNTTVTNTTTTTTATKEEIEKLKRRNMCILGLYLEVCNAEEDKVAIATLLARFLQALKQVMKTSLAVEVKSLFKALHYPSEVLCSSKVRVKQVIDVVGIAISMQNLFKPDIIREGMLEMLEDGSAGGGGGSSDVKELPPNYMRTLMQALTQHPHTMISSVLTILNRMIRLPSRLPWLSSRNWTGFVRIVSMLGRSSFPLLVSMPREHLDVLLKEIENGIGGGGGGGDSGAGAGASISGFKDAFLSFQKRKGMVDMNNY